MAYSRSTLPQLIQQVQSDIASRLAGTSPWLPYSDLQVLSYVFAALQYSQFGYLDYISQQAIPVTATGEALEAWAALKGVTRIPAAPASGEVTFSGTVGALVPDGTQVVRGDGETYQILPGLGGVIGEGGTFETTVTDIDAGSNGNMNSGGTLNLVVPVTGVGFTVSITSNFTGGTDVESDASLSSRMIQVFSNPPQGGALSDYVTWALQVPIVTRAWVAGPAVAGPGSVYVYFMCDISEVAYSGIPQGSNGGSTYEERISPATGDQLELANYLYPLRPATSLVWAMAPTAVPIPITISGIPSNTTIRAAVTAAYASVFIRTASPCGVLLPDLSNGGTVFLSDVEDAVAACPGVANFVITGFNSTTPANVVLGENGQIATPGTITYS